MHRGARRPCRAPEHPSIRASEHPGPTESLSVAINEVWAVEPAHGVEEWPLGRGLRAAPGARSGSVGPGRVWRSTTSEDGSWSGSLCVHVAPGCAWGLSRELPCLRDFGRLAKAMQQENDMLRKKAAAFEQMQLVDPIPHTANREKARVHP